MRTSVGCLAIVSLLVLGTSAWVDAAFVTFESGQVRPLALSPDGQRLFAVNTPDDHLEIFDVDANGDLTHTGTVAVGLEPVAVAARTDTEVWVVNHLSDSVSIVDVSGTPRVVRTLLVGDEPRDIVFGGPGGTRAFITAAHRGQNTPINMAVDLITPGIGRADVWVFDATNLGASLGGTPLTRVVLFADTPRALATSPDGSIVYAAAFHSGNRTTTLNEGLVCNGGAGAGPCTVDGLSVPGGLPLPNTNFQLIAQPEVGLIVKFDGTSWRDELGRSWNNAVRFTLPDKDVFAIDATANPPVEAASFAGVGTILFDVAVNPVSGKVYVSNTEARNEVRFEGAHVFGSTSVRGHLHEARITVLSGATVTPRHLNKHIDYGVVPSPAGTAAKSLAIPTGMAVDGTGTTLYVAAFGSSKVGIFSTAQLEADTFVPSASDHVVVRGGGPSGLLLNGGKHRLYVFTRFDDAVSVIDTVARAEIAHLPLHNPEPASVVNGRRFLYDAAFTSSNGEASCASCHVFGDFDSLAWDLGNPDGTVLNNLNPLRPGLPNDPDFHPMKGPMTTQSLRGMANHGPMHWRGDRNGGLDAPSVQPNGGAFDEDAAFKKFNPAFTSLLGRSAELSGSEMQAFTDFVLQVTYPPNPVRALDDSLTPDQQAGRTFYMTSNPSDTVGTCNFCHVLNPGAGFFGGDGVSVVEPQAFKIPHLRNAYQKVGMFGMPRALGFLGYNAGNNGFMGDQVRGFGFLHDGSNDTLFRFFSLQGFNQSGGNAGGFANDTQRRQMEQFVLAFDSNLAPIVGQQITITSTNAAVVGPRIDLMIARAAAGECDVVVKGTFAGQQRGAYRLPSGMFRDDRPSVDPLTTEAVVRGTAATPGQEVTYTCVPPGSGERIGVDRDGDGFYDRDELDAGSDPADPASVPGGATTTSTTTTTTTSTTPATTSTTTSTLPVVGQSILGSRFVVRDAQPGDPGKRRFQLLAKESASPNGIVGDPFTNGATLVIAIAGTTPSAETFALPAGLGWRSIPGGFKFKSQGVLRSLIIKKTPAGAFSIKASGKGQATLVPPNTGTAVQATLAIGDGGLYCTSFGGAAGGVFRPDTATLLQVAKAQAEGACP
jgi:YVTN family beta-propeller protein